MVSTLLFQKKKKKSFKPREGEKNVIIQSKNTQNQQYPLSVSRTWSIWDHLALILSLQPGTRQGLVWSGVCFPCGQPGWIPGLRDSMSFLLTFGSFLIGLKCSIFGLWSCTDYFIINSTNSFKGKGEERPVLSYVYCWLKKKMISSDSLIFQFLGSKSQWASKVKFFSHLLKIKSF